MFSHLQIRLLTLGATTLLTLASLLWQGREKLGRGLQRADRGQRGGVSKASRSLNRGAGLLAFAVAADSAQEHYRGDFHNRAMYIPLATSGLSLLTSLRGPHALRPGGSPLRDVVHLGSALSGLTGTAFHVYNIARQPGGWSMHNLFHAAPAGAPAALVLAAVLGKYADALATRTGGAQLLGMPAEIPVALTASFGLSGTTAETALLHFRGAFQNPAMYIPVIAPPLAAALLVVAVVLVPHHFRMRWLSRLLLRFTAAMGLAGAGFHALGIARRHGGWSNWRQNIQAGPPLPAPPSFTGLALAGLAAHQLLDGKRGGQP